MPARERLTELADGERVELAHRPADACSLGRDRPGCRAHRPPRVRWLRLWMVLVLGRSVPVRSADVIRCASRRPDWVSRRGRPPCSAVRTTECREVTARAEECCSTASRRDRDPTWSSSTCRSATWGHGHLHGPAPRELAGRLPHHHRCLMLLDRDADVFLARRSEAEGWMIKPLDAFRLRKAAKALLAGGEFTDEHRGLGRPPLPSRIRLSGGVGVG